MVIEFALKKDEKLKFATETLPKGCLRQKTRKILVFDYQRAIKIQILCFCVFVAKNHLFIVDS
jgi:hypothetical protein